MGMAQKFFLGLMMVLTAGVLANVATVVWDKAPNRVDDMASLQKGAKIFVNYCLNCHSAAFMRTSRLQDIGLTAKQIKSDFLVTPAVMGDTMKTAMDPQQAKTWFGVFPPDLTVMARSRAGAGGTGADYLYTFMRNFYRDPAKPTGWNNRAFPNVAMPHALWELQDTLSASQYDQFVGDLINYLQWMAEPVQTMRQRMGIWVLLFLAGLSFFTWRLNAAYWKDIR